MTDPVISPASVKNGFPAPKIKGGGQAPLWLARLNHRKANPGGAVKVGAESAMHFNLDGPDWVCYFTVRLELSA